MWIMMQFILMIFTGSALLKELWKMMDRNRTSSRKDGLWREMKSVKGILCVGWTSRQKRQAGSLKQKLALGEKVRAEAFEEIQEPII